MRSLLAVFFLIALAGAQTPTCQCPSSDPECCTFTRGFWRTHNAFAGGNQQIPWPSSCGQPAENNLIFVGTPGVTTWLALLSQPTSGDACIQGAAQWIAATLNVCNEACTDSAVDAALAGVQAILDNVTLCPGLKPATPFSGEREELILLTSVLDDYNNGEIGPGHCDDEPPECPVFDCEGGCTLTQGFWKTHNKFEKKRNLKQPWPESCLQEGAECAELNRIFTNSNLTWLEVLNLPSSGEMCIIAAKQLIAAELNVCSGACIPLELVDAALVSLPILLNKWCPSPGLPPPGPDMPDDQRKAREQAQRLAEILDLYNNGLILGPGLCDDLESLESEESVEGGVFSSTLTKSQSDTLIATVALAAAAVCLLVGLIALVWWKMRKNSKKESVSMKKSKRHY